VRAVVARQARRRESATAALVAEVLGGGGMRRELPLPVTQTLVALEQARRAPSHAAR
jgi:hypothetical protein